MMYPRLVSVCTVRLKPGQEAMITSHVATSLFKPVRMVMQVYEASNWLRRFLGKVPIVGRRFRRFKPSSVILTSLRLHGGESEYILPPGIPSLMFEPFAFGTRMDLPFMNPGDSLRIVMHNHTRKSVDVAITVVGEE